MSGLYLKMPIALHARNQPSSPSRHKLPTRAPPLSFFLCFLLSLSYTQRATNPPTGSARPGNSTICSVLPPGGATSPVLDCTSTCSSRRHDVQWQLVCDLPNTWFGPPLLQLSASETKNLGAHVFIPAESETLALEQSSFCCVPSLL